MFPGLARRRRASCGPSSASHRRGGPAGGRGTGRLSEPPVRKKTEEKALAAPAKPKAKVERRALLGHVLPAVERAVAELREHPAAERVSEAGSVRRRCETVHDLDIIATATDPARSRPISPPCRGSQRCSHAGRRRPPSFRTTACVDSRVVPPESYGSLLQHFTGSAVHNVALREDAVRRKLSVPEYGVENTETGEVFHAADEEELTGTSAMSGSRRSCVRIAVSLLPRATVACRASSSSATCVATYTCTRTGRTAAARPRRWPTLCALGHSYIAICDHAKRLKDGRLELQAEAIMGQREHESGMRVLSGVEVDIRADGSVDMPDEVLAERDWVMASIHSGFDQPRDRSRSG